MRVCVCVYAYIKKRATRTENREPDIRRPESVEPSVETEPCEPNRQKLGVAQEPNRANRTEVHKLGNRTVRTEPSSM